MTQPIITDVLKRRRDRSIAQVLGYKDRECNRFLPEDVSERLRTIILDAFNDFHNLTVDVMKSLDDGTYAINDHYLTAMESINAQLGEIREAIHGDDA